MSIGLAGAPHVDADRRIAVSGEPTVHRFVPRPGAIALAIGNIFKDGGNRLLGCVLWQPESRGEAGAVGKRDEEMFGNGDCRHGRGSSSMSVQVAPTSRSVKQGVNRSTGATVTARTPSAARGRSNPRGARLSGLLRLLALLIEAHRP